MTNSISPALVATLLTLLSGPPVGAQTTTNFGTVTVDPAFEIDGTGKNVDSIAFWETPVPADMLMFVTGKENNLLEVWRYPFVGNELSPIEFPSTVNGVAVDQEKDLLYVTESGAKKVTVLSLSNLELRGEFGEGILEEGETNIDILKMSDGKTVVYVTDDHTVHFFDAESGTHEGSFSPPVQSIETVLADDFYQLVMVPEEQGPAGNAGVYVFNPDGSPFEQNGSNRFGNDGEFESDEEGILLYTFPPDGVTDNGLGFIVVSDQKDDLTDFEFFDRQSWQHLGTLRISNVSNTDGIASTQKALPDYPRGLFVAVNDDKTTVGVAWDVILQATGLVTKVYEHARNAVPEAFSMKQNYPNPFNPSTTIDFSVPRVAFITLKVYDLMGREIVTLVETELQAGDYSAKFNGADYSISNGIYLCRIRARDLSTHGAPDFIAARKLILLK